MPMQATELRRAVLDLQVRDLVAASVAGGRGVEGGSNGLRCVPLGSREGACVCDGATPDVHADTPLSVVCQCVCLFVSP